MRMMLRVTSLLLGAFCAGAPLSAAGLRAGAAKRTITPDVHAGRVYMAGFGHNRVATGVRDELYARCLALSAADQTVVVCSVDLIGLFLDDVEKVRAKVKSQVPEVTHVIVAATHNHEGPDTMGLWGPTPFESGINEAYLDWVNDRIAEAALEAVQSREPARLTLARDDHPLLAQLQNDSRPPYVKDPFLFVMRLVAVSSDRPIATLVNWSDHPETLGGKNTEITADYPHWLCQRVEQRIGGMALFFVGSIGGLLSTLGEQVVLQNPATGEIAKDDTWKKAELFGTLLGDLAVRALAAGEDFDVDAIAVRKASFFVPLQNDRFRVAVALDTFKGRKALYTDGEIDSSVSERDYPGFGRLKYSTAEEVQTEVNYIQILRRSVVVAEIATAPGEIYPELINGGIERFPGADYFEAPMEPALRPHLKSKYQLVFGLGNDEIGYIIPKAEWDDAAPWLKGKAERWYGEINSVGPEVAGAVMRALVNLIESD